MYTVPSTRNRPRIDSRRGPSWHRHPFPLHLLPDHEVVTGEQVKPTRRIETARKVIARCADAAATSTVVIEGPPSHAGLGDDSDGCYVELKSRRPRCNALKRRLVALPPLPVTGGVLAPVPVIPCDVVSRTDNAAVLVIPTMDSDEVLRSDVANVLCEVDAPWRLAQARR